MASRTPAHRNRYVDFLRAASILVVIVGHWLIATGWYVDGKLVTGHLLEGRSIFAGVTWVFQVMPIFFMVGGYANAMSLDSSRRRGAGYAEWLVARLHRLAVPLVAVLITWGAIAAALLLLGVEADTVQVVSRASLIPTWFLAIYIMLVVLAPPAYAAWRRFGMGSFWLLAALAVATDVLFFAADLRALGWSNYFWVWLAVHQLGFVWSDGRQGGSGRLLAVAAAALAVLYVVTVLGPYPLALVSSPGEVVSNTLPPKATLLLLGVAQFGVLLAMEAPMRRALEGSRLWTGTVLINGMIMTLYLWHMTLMAGVMTILFYAGGVGLGVEPGGAAWWVSRPIWVTLLMLLLVPTAMMLSPLERSARHTGSTVPSGWRQVTGAAVLCLGVAWLAMHGYLGGPIPRGDLAALGLVVVGAAAIGMRPRLAGD
jgi:fucose 4-O-acetylase-like acetyltransferase